MKASCTSILTGGILAALLSLYVPAASAQDEMLAQRFRPFIKTTLDNGKDEPFHPANWQWIAARSNLFRAGSILIPNAQLSSNLLALVDPKYGGNFTVNNAGQTDPGLELGLTGADATSGEPWAAVVHQGHGIYAHVEHINNDLVNIEYTIVWPRNAAIGSNHDGDLTTMIVVFDQAADRLARVSYSIHGCVLEAYELKAPRKLSYDQLSGKNEAFQDASVEVARINISDQNAATSDTRKCRLIDSEQHIFLAQDPDSHLYEHPVAFAESGAHELWPNGSGWVSTAPAHDGNGVSFLPDQVQVLGTLANPRSEHFPFIFYNGKFGDDPQAIVLHKSWFWPEGRDSQKFIRADRFADQDPYLSLGTLPWPPSAWNGPASVTFVAPRTSGTSNSSFDGSQQSPVLGLAFAYSVTPQNWTLSLAPGVYLEPVLLGKKMLIVASGGPVVIGGVR